PNRNQPLAVRFSGSQPVGRADGGLVARVAQQRLADALPQDPGLAPGRAEHGPTSFVATGVAVVGPEAAWATVERKTASGRGLEREPGEPTHLLRRRLERDAHLLPTRVYETDQFAAPIGKWPDVPAES